LDVGLTSQLVKKKYLDIKFHGRRPVGRPRLRWEDNILVAAVYKRWRRIVRDRDIWSQLLKRPVPDAGCRTIKEEVTTKTNIFLNVTPCTQVPKFRNILLSPY
jgi:hypothetical protein